uniref:Uncharacterized protein n=1 Tax=Arundo donax TaxID=35708 RepID=A0A0A8YHG6_ARUDO
MIMSLELHHSDTIYVGVRAVDFTPFMFSSTDLFDGYVNAFFVCKKMRI